MLLRMYTRWAEQHGYKVEWLEESPGEEAGHQIRHPPGHRPQRLWLAEDRERRAPPGAHLALRQRGAPPYQLRLGLGLSGDRRQDRDRDPGQGSAHRHLSRLGRRRPARQQDRQRDPHHPHADRHRRRSARPTARSTATAPWPWRCCRRGSTSWSCRSARRRPATLESAKTDIGWGHQIRSYVLQPYQMVKDLRTGVETSNTQGVLDGDLDQFLEASLAARIQGGGEAAAQ